MRPIDADALIKHLKDELEGCVPPVGGRAHGKTLAYGTSLGLKMAISYVDVLPTADVVPREEHEEVKAATVRKMRDLIEERCIKGGIYPVLVKNTINKVAEEMLEDVK